MYQIIYFIGLLNLMTLNLELFLINKRKWLKKYNLLLNFNMNILMKNLVMLSCLFLILYLTKFTLTNIFIRK